MKASKTSLSWEIIGFDWRNGSFLPPKAWGDNPPPPFPLTVARVRLSISNTAINQSVSCYISDYTVNRAILPFDTNMLSDKDWEHAGFYACDGSYSAFSNQYAVPTYLLFDPERGRLGVYQSWFCDDEDPRKP
jgi:hypothetical protein